MTTRMSFATGNFTAAGTWEVCDATSESDSEAANTVLTTSFVESSTFTPGAITVDGIAVKVASRVSSPSGTMSVHLAIAGVEVAGTAVTINVSDINFISGVTGTAYDWVFFKFSASVLLVGATLYSVGAKTSSGSQVNLFSSATTNWSRQLRTTTTGAPSAGDKLIVAGECTGAGTGNNLTVTMDNTNTTDFGTNAAIGGLYVSNRGTLTWGVAASTDYNLRLSGDLRVCSGGTYNKGTVATPLPASSTSKLELDCTVSGDFGVIVYDGGIYVDQGNALSFDRTLLAANVAVNGTSLTSSDSTGWLSGNAIAIASTTRTYTECENGTLNGNASGTTITVNGFGGAGGGVAYAHSGTSPTQAEIINLTRNSKTTVVTTSALGYVLFNTTASVDIDWAEYSYMGSNASNKYGIVALTTTGAININRSSIHDGYTALFTTGAAYNNITLNNSVCYKFANHIININTVSTGTSITLNNNILMYTTGASTNGINLNYDYVTITNNTIVGTNNDGMRFTQTFLASANVSLSTFSNNTVHSVNSIGIYFLDRIFNCILTNTTVWRCNNAGIWLDATNENITFDTITCFGNYQYNLEIKSSSKITMLNPTFNGDTTFSTESGIDTFSHTSYADWIIENGDFGSSSGIKTSHTVGDIAIYNNTYYTGVLRNTKLSSPTEVAFPYGTATMCIGSYIKSQKHDQTAGNHKSWFKYGIITIDTSIFHTASPSQRLTPNNASNKLESGSQKVAILNGTTVTPSVWIRKSAIGDGAAYNGNQPRLILKKNLATGISADTVLDTMTVAVGNWEQLTAATTPAVTDDGVLEFVVDCDGTAGWVNVDDWTVA